MHISVQWAADDTWCRYERDTSTRFVDENMHSLQSANVPQTPGNEKQMQQRNDTSATDSNTK